MHMTNRVGCESTLATCAQIRKITAATEANQGHALHGPASREYMQQFAGLSKVQFTNAMKACSLQEVSFEAVTDAGTSISEGQSDSTRAGQIGESQNDGTSTAVDAKELVQGALQRLPCAEASVIRHVYGLQDGIPKSRPQVCRCLPP